MTHAQQSNPDEQANRPSTFAAALAGIPPSMRRPPPPGAVRLHLLDDVPAAKAAAPDTGRPAPASKSVLDFTAAHKSLIRNLHGHMLPQQLLHILNERLACDRGQAAAPYTIEQLHAEIARVASATPTAGNDWASLRKLLDKARRDGVLDGITEQVIDDFAVVYSLTQRQVLILKDSVLRQKDDE